MNEVHVATAKVVLLSLISGAAVALITHLFSKKINTFSAEKNIKLIDFC